MHDIWPRFFSLLHLMRHVQKCNVGSSWPRTAGGTLHRCPLQSNCNSGLGARSKSDPWTDRPEPGHKCKQVMTPSSTTQSYVLFKYIYNFLEWRLSDFDRILLVLLQIFFFVAWEKKKTPWRHQDSHILQNPASHPDIEPRPWGPMWFQREPNQKSFLW